METEADFVVGAHGVLKATGAGTGRGHAASGKAV